MLVILVQQLQLQLKMHVQRAIIVKRTLETQLLKYYLVLKELTG